MSQFSHMSSGTESFYCVYCTLQKQALEINKLKKTVQTLVSDMVKISSGDAAGRQPDLYLIPLLHPSLLQLTPCNIPIIEGTTNTNPNILPVLILSHPSGMKIEN